LWAAAQGHEAVVTLLLEKGASTDSTVIIIEKMPLTLGF
jgi:ankyrin repeat protein